MNYIIAPALFQHQRCRIPGIGTLQVIKPATSVDFINTKLIPGVPAIQFVPETSNDHGFNEFAAVGQMILNDVKNKGVATLQGIGKFFNSSDGSLEFSPALDAAIYLPSVTAERIIRQDATHSILVGDRETDNVVMTEFYADKPSVKDWWWVWAIAIGILAIGLLVFHFVTHGVQVGSFASF